MAMVAALPSFLNHSSSTIRLVELSTWQGLQRMELITGEDGCYSTISSQLFHLYNQVNGAESMARVAENGTDHRRGMDPTFLSRFYLLHSAKKD
jgi:hypothetical protein